MPKQKQPRKIGGEAQRIRNLAGDEIQTNFDDPMLTLSEAGAIVGKSRQTIRRWIADGLLRGVRDPSGLHRVRRSELLKFYGASALAAAEDGIESENDGD